MRQLITGQDNNIQIELYQESNGSRVALSGSPVVSGALTGLKTGAALHTGLTFTQGADLLWEAPITAAETDAALLDYQHPESGLADEISQRQMVQLQVYVGGNYKYGDTFNIRVMRGRI